MLHPAKRNVILKDLTEEGCIGSKWVNPLMLGGNKKDIHT